MQDLLIDNDTLEMLKEFGKIAIQKGWIQKMIHFFRKKHSILILGSTGTGKTNFIESLISTAPEAISYMNRTDFTKEHQVHISKELFALIDTPGQSLHSTYRMEAIRDGLKEGLSGIINVVSYGYHEYRIGSSDAIDNYGNINPSFLEQHREYEIKALSEWVNILGSPSTAGWLITLISKADLWWDHKDVVIKHYESGKYFDYLESAKALHHIVIPYCSVIHKFYGKAPVSGHLDDKDKMAMKINFICKLIEAIGKE